MEKSTDPNSTQLDCPDTQLLHAWLDSRQELSEAQNHHLRDCPRCAERLLELTDDAVLNGFSQPEGIDDFSREPEFQKLRLQLKKIDAVTRAADEDTKPDLILHAETEQGGSNVDDEPTGFGIQSLLPEARYRIDRLLATGGSGRVFLAFDTRLNQPVAIKVLARESLRDQHRFAREARVLADIVHPNVVRLFDFGVLGAGRQELAERDSTGAKPDARHYLAMEYLAGGTLADLQEESSVRTVTQFRELAEWIAQAADGLNAAHEKGLIHRDIKPNNILLDADKTQTRLIDFGLARLEDRDASRMTRDGSMLGTPAFMSPEQISDDVELTQSTDIYSLGATLYAAMTGQPPFQGHPTSVVRQVAEVKPAAPRILNPEIPVDLETICLKAMESAPQQRYLSATEFAADLRRFCQGEPIFARPASAWTLARRFLRQNPALATSLALTALLAMVLLVGTTSAIILLGNKNQELLAAVAGEREAKEFAVQSLRDSIAAADELLLSVTTETEFLPRTPGSQEVSKALLEKARGYFQKFVDTNRESPVLRYQLARAHAGLATVAARTGDLEQLEAETNFALEIIDSIPETELSVVQRSELKIRTLTTFANYLIESGEAKRAIPLLDKAIASGAKLDSLDIELQTLSSLESVALAHLGQANAFRWVGETDSSIAQLLIARNAFERLLTESPTQSSYLRNLATTYMMEASSLIDRDRSSEGIRALEKAQALLGQTDPKEGISLRVKEMQIKNLTNLALAQKRLGDFAKAKELYAATIEEAKLLIALEPGVPAHQWNLVVAVLNSGGPDLALGNLEELVQRWQNVEPVLEDLQVQEPDSSRYRQVHAMLKSNIAIVLRDMGKLDEAIEPLLGATAILLEHAERQNLAPEPYLAVALNHFEIASTYIELEDTVEAEQQLAMGDRISQEILVRHPEFVAAKAQLVDNLFARHLLSKKQSNSKQEALKGQSASENAKLALELSQQLVASNPDESDFTFDLTQAWLNLAEVQREAKNYVQAWESASTAEEQAKKNADTEAEEVKQHLQEALFHKTAALFELRKEDQEFLPDVDYSELRSKAVDLGVDESVLPGELPE
ncbi:MAG: serine/threonine-protein kinase [Planctomycetota bacterium]